MKMKMKNPINNLHIPEEWSWRGNQNFEQIKSVHRGRGGSRIAATYKMERFVIILNGFQALNIITKRSILDVAAVLDPPLRGFQFWSFHLKANPHNQSVKG